MLSKTAAKRQAHRESSMHRQPGAGWTVTAISEPAKAYTLGHGLSFSGARRELAAWRAARARELVGGGLLRRHGWPCHCKLDREGKPMPGEPCATPAWQEAGNSPAPPAAPEARGDSSPRGEKGGLGRP